VHIPKGNWGAPVMRLSKFGSENEFLGTGGNYYHVEGVRKEKGQVVVTLRIVGRK